MSVLLRMYAPMLALLLTALVVGTVGLSRPAAVGLALLVAASFKVQVDEARRQHAKRRQR